MSAPEAPVVRVERGRPSAEELAAVLGVLSAAAAATGSDGPSGGRRSAWSERSRLVRRPPATGPGAWRRSALPR